MHTPDILDYWATEIHRLGIQQTCEEWTASAILRVLESRLAPEVALKVKPELEKIDDLQRLERLLGVALCAENPEEFYQVLQPNGETMRKMHHPEILEYWAVMAYHRGYQESIAWLRRAILKVLEVLLAPEVALKAKPTLEKINNLQCLKLLHRVALRVKNPEEFYKVLETLDETD